MRFATDAHTRVLNSNPVPGSVHLWPIEIFSFPRGHGDTACKQFELSGRSAERLSRLKPGLSPSWRMVLSPYNTATLLCLARWFGPIHARGSTSFLFKWIIASDERRPENSPAGS